jgi:hypothetical protein
MGETPAHGNCVVEYPMTSLPSHGRIDCTLCYRGKPVKFDHTRRTVGDWRITANPLAWGNPNAEIVILGFSKGPTQAGALATVDHDDIAARGRRLQVGKIIAHIGLISTGRPASLKAAVGRLIADRKGRFHFGSLVRCTVERFDRNDQCWKGSGGGMLDKFVDAAFGREVTGNCAIRFLSGLPDATRLVVMFGLGSRGKYVREARRLFELARPGVWRDVNEVAYSDGTITTVHVEHFASQGALIPNWLGINPNERSRLGLLARDAVAGALNLRIAGQRSPVGRKHL